MAKLEVPTHSPFIVKLERGETYRWCACGRSQTQPFCDGSHAGTGIEPLEFVHDRQPNEFSVCGCKHTEKPPMCDGSHRALMTEADADENASERRFPRGEAANDEHTADCEFGIGVPDLPVKDAPVAVRYYSEVLGFEKIYDDAVTGFDHVMYACMGRGTFHLTLDEHRAEEAGASIQVTCNVSEVDALHAEFVARGARIVEPLTDRVWQERDFTVVDLDGHRLSFTMKLNRSS